MTNTPMTFEEWWQSEGQYVRSGGGDYEKIFAFEAWQANQANNDAVRSRMKRVIQGYEGEISVNGNTIAELVEALELAKVTFIANKMDVRNVMEVINQAIAKVKGK